MMPQLSVIVRTRNPQEYIRQTIASILAQADIDLELIVIDDHSADDSLAILQSFTDARLTVVSTQKKEGLATCLNIAVEQSEAPVIVFIDANGVLFPHALSKVAAIFHGPDRPGYACCFTVKTDNAGKLYRKNCQGLSERISRMNHTKEDYLLSMITGNPGNIGLHIYNKAILQQSGLFNKRWAAELHTEMAVRIARHYPIKIIPQILYGRRRGNASKIGALKAGRERTSLLLALQRQNFLSFLDDQDLSFSTVTRGNIFRTLRHAGFKSVKFRAFAKKLKRLWRRKIYLASRDALYELQLRFFPHWPLFFSTTQQAKSPVRNQRLGYYLAWFPVLSETFIQREVIAVKKKYPSLKVFANEPQDVTRLDESARALMDQTHYLGNIDPTRLQDYRKTLIRSHPLKYLNAFFLS